ncbi:hypothetical protein MMPV_005851 [Pyropia vietnamensis]
MAAPASGGPVEWRLAGGSAPPSSPPPPPPPPPSTRSQPAAAGRPAQGMASGTTPAATPAPLPSHPPPPPISSSSSSSFSSSASLSPSGGGAAVTPPPKPDALLLVLELCRHGARTPLFELPGGRTARAPAAAATAPGALTPAGAAAHTALGARLRARYLAAGLFSPTEDPANVAWVRSTHTDRTILSANAQLAGLFPPMPVAAPDCRRSGGSGDGGCKSSPPWQAVPVHVESAASDSLLLPGRGCPRLASLLAARPASAEWVAYERGAREMLGRLSRALGVSSRLRLQDVSHVNDVVVAEAAAARAAGGGAGAPGDSGGLPGHAARTLGEPLVSWVGEVADWLVRQSVKGAEVQTLKSGLWLGDVVARLRSAADADASGFGQGTAVASPGPVAVPPSLEASIAEAATRAARGGAFGVRPRPAPAPRFVLYSAHDTTLAAALATLDLLVGPGGGRNPPFNSSLLVELWRRSPPPAVVAGRDGRTAAAPTPSYAVRLLYNERVVELGWCRSGTAAGRRAAAINRHGTDAAFCPLPAFVAGTAARTSTTTAVHATRCSLPGSAWSATLRWLIGWPPESGGPAAAAGDSPASGASFGPPPSHERSGAPPLAAVLVIVAAAAGLLLLAAATLLAGRARATGEAAKPRRRRARARQLWTSAWAEGGGGTATMTRMDGMGVWVDGCGGDGRRG